MFRTLGCLVLLLVCWSYHIYVATSFIDRQATCNAETFTVCIQNGVSVSLNPQSVAISGSSYYVNVQSQDAYDIKLSLRNKEWGFDPFYNTSLILTLDGYTPFPDSDADILIVFSVDNIQYFSFFLHLDSSKIKSRIYASMAMDNNDNKGIQLQNVSEWISDTISIPQRWHRISNNNQWIVLHQWRNKALWPLKFVITNDPSKKFCVFQFYHDIINISYLAISYAFNHTFIGNKNMDIYIMGDSKNEQYIISSFQISLKKHSPTQNSTFLSTNIPSKLPIEISLDIHTNSTNNNTNNNNNKNNGDTHILIFTILISCASFVVLIQICCIIKKRIKKKCFKNKQFTHHTIKTHSHSHICDSMYRIRKPTVSTTEKFEYNLDGRRTINAIDTVNTVNTINTINTIHAVQLHTQVNDFEGINNTQPNDDTEFEQSEFGLMDAHTINQYWKNHADIDVDADADHM